MLNIQDSILVIIDVQEKLVNAASNGTKISSNMTKLAKTANVLDVPTIVTEQYPQGLGQTVIELSQVLPNSTHIIEKTSFSAMREEPFKRILKAYNRKQIIIGGIEGHICILQTVFDLIKEGYEVYIVKDCTSSRRSEEFNIGIELAKQYGAKVTCLEIALFEWLKSSKHPNFKEIQALIK